MLDPCRRRLHSDVDEHVLRVQSRGAIVRSDRARLRVQLPPLSICSRAPRPLRARVRLSTGRSRP